MRWWRCSSGHAGHVTLPPCGSPHLAVRSVIAPYQGELNFSGAAGTDEKIGKRDESQMSPLSQMSQQARAVLDAGRELWRYYHAQPNANSNGTDAHKDKLSMLQRLELIARLHGRRLTFTCNVGCVEGSAKGAAKLQAWVAAGVRLRFDMNPPVQFSEVNKVRRITGTADIRNLEGCLNLGALSFHDAVLED